LSAFNPTSAGAGITIPSIEETFAFGLYAAGCEGCYVGGLSNLCHKWVIDVQKRLNYLHHLILCGLYMFWLIFCHLQVLTLSS